MSIERIVAEILGQEKHGDVTLIHFEGKCGNFESLPGVLSPSVITGLKKLGINEIYTHQLKAIDIISKGQNVVIATPTASGKTLCYNAPILSELENHPESRAIYLYPTKALTMDQSTGLRELLEAAELKFKTSTYDGDTSVSIRQMLRVEGSIILSNPDMLHTAILPHHTKWIHLFENLKFVVIDELHHYRGVFGSHMANVIRRLKRICAFYGSHPQFIMSSATISNPGELASKIIEDNVQVINEDGSPHGDKFFFIYNPPIVDKQLGLRRSSLFESKRFALKFIQNGIQTIIFARARLAVENILKLLRDEAGKLGIKPDLIRGYRGGYLPLERREIEKGLREGNILAIVSTNALELGIDIGRLEAAIISGYPGSIASLRQQAGRAGRKQQSSMAILVLTGNPIDQYIALNPKYILETAPESGLVNPDNLYVMVSHIKCAAFELPFIDGEMFGNAEISKVLDFLEKNEILNHADGKWFWMADSYPADEVSLRNATEGNVTIIDTTNSPNVRTVGEVDLFGAHMLVHEQAIYIHDGQTYHVDKFDPKERKAFIRRMNLDYYTDANLEVSISVLDESNKAHEGLVQVGFGEVSVTAITTIFKKIKFDTHENLGYGEVHLDEQPMDTMAWWLIIPTEISSQFSKNEMGNALQGLGNLLIGILPLPLMCDRRDIGIHIQVKSPHFDQPTIFIYETNAGGVGLVECIFDMGNQVFVLAKEALEACVCENGCPSCVGPPGGIEAGSKTQTKKLINLIIP